MSTWFAPASLDEIEDAEAELNLKFPRDLWLAYLRHNGSSGDPQLPGLFVGHIAEWLSLSDMKAYWRIAREISLEAWPDNCDSPADAEMNQGKVRRDVWNRGRIPVGRVHANDHFLLIYCRVPLELSANWSGIPTCGVIARTNPSSQPASTLT